MTPLCALFPATLLLSLACTGPVEKDNADDVPDDAVEAVGEPRNVVLDDTSSGLSVTITGSTATGWLFGNIYPDASEYDEACLDDGDVCHELGADGGALDWCDRGDEDCTAMPQLYWRTGEGSFVLLPIVGVGCFTWGDDADYWDDLGCTRTSWDPSSY